MWCNHCCYGEVKKEMGKEQEREETEVESYREAAKMLDLEKLVEFTGQMMEEKCILKKLRE